MPCSSRWRATSRRRGRWWTATPPERRNRPATVRRRMSLTKEKTREVVTKFGGSEADTGSARVQIALLTERINDLTDHLRTHTKDHHSRRGLLMLVGRRRRFLDYLQRNNLEGYRALIKELGLRR